MIDEIASISGLHIGNVDGQGSAHLAKIALFQQPLTSQHTQYAKASLKRGARDCEGVLARVRSAHLLSPRMASSDTVAGSDAAATFVVEVASPMKRSIIIWYRASNDVDNIGQDATWHPVNRQPVQMVQLVEKAVDDVVPDVGVTHGVRQRRDQIGKCDHRKIDPLPRFRVFHHAKAIAA